MQVRGTTSEEDCPEAFNNYKGERLECPTSMQFESDVSKLLPPRGP